MIYLDHAATTPVDPRVVEAMLPYWQGVFGNPSSVHAAGRRAQEAVEDAREEVARLLGARPEEIVFTSGGTEADNLALRGVLRVRSHEGRTKLVVSAVEHEAVAETARVLEREGWQVEVVPAGRDGRVSPAEVAARLDARTALVSLLLVQNETGVVQPVAEVAALAHAAGALMHTDAVAAVPTLAVDVDALGVDLLSLSAHKFYGPKGVGALYVRRGVGLAPVLTGGGQERSRRSGTLNVPGIVGLGEAARLLRQERQERAQRMAFLRERLWQAVRSIPGVHRTGEGVETAPGILHVRVEGAPADSVVIGLDREGVCASAGSACSSGAVGPSHVLLGMGWSREEARSGVRLSLGKDTAEEDIDSAAQALAKVVDQVRRAHAARPREVAGP